MRRVFKSEYFRGNHQVGESIGEIGGYKALSILGHGAGSTVYEVQDPVDGRLYALKVVVKSLPTDQRFIDQAMNEHEVGSRLNHPALRRSIKVLREGGMMAVNKLMLLLELVDGVTLEARRPRSRKLMVELFKSVATGLGAMHEAGTVHADMKPINILLENSGGIKIIDFGQSCAINTVKTRIQGTLDYIAPEQVKRGPITPRTDVYNLGATMYWCVTDRHPPTALRLRGMPGMPMTDVDTVLHDPRDYNPHLPPALALLILDCLQHEPSARPANMRDVRFRLDMALHQLNAERRVVMPPKPVAVEIEPVLVEPEPMPLPLQGVAPVEAPTTMPESKDSAEITPQGSNDVAAAASESLLNDATPHEPVAVPQLELTSLPPGNKEELDLPTSMAAGTF